PFDPLKWGISPANLQHIDTTQLLALLVAEQALHDAGLQGLPGDAIGSPFARERCSVILGVTGPQEMVIPLGARLGHDKWRAALRQAGLDEELIADLVRRIGEQYVPWQENSFPGLLGNVVAGRIANKFDLGGTNCVVDAACASSFSAIHMAAMELADGRCDLALSGGCDTFNDIFMYTCFSKTPALSPSGVCRPFDSGADGMLLGEGLGLVVLKRLADAEAAGDRIYGILRGIGTSSDGAGMAVYAPSGPGQQRALADAYRTAAVDPRSVTLYEAHGTGTKVGDATEIGALCAHYRAHGSGTWCAIGSVKSQIGHTKAAAGIAGLIKCLLALRARSLPPTGNVRSPAASLVDAPVYVNANERPWLPMEGPRRAAVSAFGFGGSNYHCVLEEHGEDTSVDWRGDVLLLPVHGADAGSTAESLQALAAQAAAQTGAAARWSVVRAAARAACQAAVPPADAVRCCLVLRREVDPLTSLRTAIDRLQAGETDWQLPDGSSCGYGAAAGGLAALFPGQGSQGCGMLNDLACRFPAMRASLQLADALDPAKDQAGHARLSDLIHPPARFDAAEEDADEQALRATDRAQPALGAICCGAWRILQDFGLQADAAAGHSFGELCALVAGGRLDAADCLHLAHERGRAMAAAAAAADSASGMWACTAEAGLLHELISDQELDLVMANDNAPGQQIVAGALADGERLAQLLAGRGARAVRLPVAAAFHSRFVAGARERFASVLEEQRLHRAGIPVFANRSGAPYSPQSAAARQTLAAQLVEPVRWQDCIRGLHEHGIRCFVEVGPGTVLSGLTRRILSEQDDCHILSLDASRGRDSAVADCARLLARLWSLGRGIDLAPWDAGYVHERDPDRPITGRLQIPLCGANQYQAPAPRPPARQPQTASAAARDADAARQPHPPVSPPPMAAAPSPRATPAAAVPPPPAPPTAAAPRPASAPA
ncbi:MAG: beta-ketoacyl synthase N-terminal-like domain-containing protein, partial [Planctomycetota bacterium]